MADQDTPSPTITAIKIPIIKKGEYDIWSMRMRQYICHTDHNLWDIIVNGDLEDETTPSGEQSSPHIPKTAKQLVVRRNQERFKSILLLAIPDEYLLKFHNVLDTKSLWAAIKSRFGGNEESKKMQKNVLKHQFENFVTASNETLDKAYDRFQKLISQLEIHGAYVSKEDINQKFLRSLPPSWSQIALIMRNKPDIDEIDIDDLYNNLRVYEDEMKKSSTSSSNTQNLAFLSSENTNSTNEVSTVNGDFGISAAGGINHVPTTPCAQDIAYSFLAQPTTSPQLENEDFQQMDEDDLEKLDLRWHVVMLTVRVKKFIQRIGRNMDFKEKQLVSLDKSKIECYNCYRKGHFARECRSGKNQGRRSFGDNGKSNAPINESSSQALVAQDGLGGYDWSNNFKVEPVNYALMVISSSSSSSSSDSEHNKAKLEIRGYEIALESLESRILGHEKNELAWGEKYEFQNYELKCREIKINNLNLELEKVVKERDELKIKIAKWEDSTKNLDEILNSQMSARDKSSLGYSTQLNELSSNHETDSENSFSIFDGRTRNFLTPRADISFEGLDEYVIRNKIIKSQTSELNTKTSETSGQTNTASTVKNKSASESVKSNPKINRHRVIIKDWTSDDKEEVSAVQTVRLETQTVKTRDDKSGQNSKKQGICFRKVKACFVCKSTDHLIKDCNFHDKKSQEPKLKNVVNTGQRVVKQVWDNTKRVNHQNFSKYPHLSKTFVPSGVLTRKGFINTARPICTARPSISTARPSVSTVRPVCTAKPSISTARPCVSTARPVYASRPIYPRMDNVRPRGSCLPNKRSYYTKPAFRPKDLKQDVKTFGVKNMTTAGTRAVGNPEIVLQDHAVVDSGCSSHMTGNKAYLSDYEDFNRGFVAFGSDPKGDELKFNLFSVSQICDKKNSVLFTDTECLILSPSFKLLDESQVVLRAPRKDDVYSFDLKNIVPSGGLENQLNHKVKTIRCDHGKKFKNYDMNVFCAKKWIKREYSVARTPQQNGKPPSISFMRPFGCPLTILNTLDPLGKFDGKSDEGYLLRYSTTSKAFRVYNKRTKRVEENMHIDFLEDQPNVAGSGPDWMPKILVGDVVQNIQNKPSKNAYKDKDVQDTEDAADKEEQHQMTENAQDLQYELEKMISQELAAKAMNDDSRQAFEEEKRRIASQKKVAQATSTNILSTDRPFVSTNKPSVSIISTPTRTNVGELSFVYLGGTIPIDASTLPNADLPIDPNMHDLEDASETLPNDGIFNRAYDDNEDVGAMADINNMDNSIAVSPIPTLRIHKDHPKG
ncbi:ribonuclease H-like domain-containing protein [Tanacetum coccineum]